MKYLVFFVGLFIFSSCATTQPAFNANDKVVKFIEGKPFLIPRYAGVGDKLIGNQPKRYIKVQKQSGYDCKKGYAAWQDATVMLAMKKITDAETFNQKLYQSWLVGKAGCSRPLTNQEYHYYRSKELENSANRRAQLNYAAATAPVFVNVSHSGTISHTITSY